MNGNFAAFCERNQSSMFNVAMYFLQNTQDAEDAVQIALERIFRLSARVEFETERAEHLYARQTVRSVSIDMLRQRKHTEEIPETIQSPEGAPFSVISDKESAREILHILGPKASAIFSYRNMGLMDVEIAGLLGITVSDVRTTVYRARLRIAKAMEQQEGC